MISYTTLKTEVYLFLLTWIYVYELWPSNIFKVNLQKIHMVQSYSHKINNYINICEYMHKKKKGLD